jgi:hypothetical protein
MERRDKFLYGATLLIALGCGSGERKEGLAPVTGRITYDGQLVPAGQIYFYPVDGKRSSSGTIDADGKYALTSYKSGDGALIGKHRVVIDATQPVGPLPNPDSPEAFKAAPLKPPERILPAQYYNQATTPLEAEVEDEENVIDFNIPK